jgi:hypothetical protein
MPILTSDKRAHHILKSDIYLLLRLISDKNKLNLFPLTKGGRAIVKMVWADGKSFSQIGKKLSLSPARVTHIYNVEIRRFAFFIDKAYSEYKQFHELKKNYESLKKENKLLKNKSRLLRRSSKGDI